MFGFGCWSGPHTPPLDSNPPPCVCGCVLNSPQGPSIEELEINVLKKSLAQRQRQTSLPPQAARPASFGLGERTKDGPLAGTLPPPPPPALGSATEAKGSHRGSRFGSPWNSR